MTLNQKVLNKYVEITIRWQLIRFSQIWKMNMPIFTSIKDSINSLYLWKTNIASFRQVYQFRYKPDYVFLWDYVSFKFFSILST